MKKFIGGLLIAATMLTPVAPSMAQDRGQASDRSARYDRDSKQRDTRQRDTRQRDTRQRDTRQRDNRQSQQPRYQQRDDNRKRDIRPEVQRRNQQDRARVQRERQQRVEQERRTTRQRDQLRKNQRQDQRYDNRNGQRNDRRYNNRQNDNRSWNRDWRRDNRYNYNDYRTRNRNVYRMPRYQPPSRNYRYSRFQIGRNINSSFYNQRYWISNPNYYRLPPAYGNYRWVRYYNDAMLVDVRRGNVVDVLYNFFW